MSPVTQTHRRWFLQGIAGASLILPRLEIFANENGKGEAPQRPRRFCAMYTANGMCLPDPANGIDDWSWFPKIKGHDFQFGQSTAPFAPFRDHMSFLGGLYHPNGVKADPHVCSDMWLTGAPLHNAKPGTYKHRVARSGHCAAYKAVLSPAISGAVDRCGSRVSVTDRHDLIQSGRKTNPSGKQSPASL